MIRRILIGLVPALAALTLLTGAPAAGATGNEAASLNWDHGPAKAAKRSLHEDRDDSSLNGRADDQDDPDRIIHGPSAIAWPLFAAPNAPLLAAHFIPSTRSPCATPPRGPPTA